MAYMDHMAFAPAGGIQELSFEEIDGVAAASRWGENVLKYGGVGLALGGFVGGPQGAAAGALVGAAVGTAVTFLDD